MAKADRYQRAKKLLGRYDPPHEVSNLFDELCAIDARLDKNLQAKPSDLLFDACRRSNFTKPFELDGRKRYFRARLLDGNHPDYCSDTAPMANKPGSAAIEQAYRRGFVQGFAELRRMLFDRSPPENVLEAEKRFQKWRTAQIQIIGSFPGHDESISLNVDNCRNISLKLRYNIMYRDKFRCQICGNDAANGAFLEIDHKISVADGGDDSEENLWTLCFDCNRGKGASSL
ncbi:MAG TPA: HNH endonuclease signature motif containing protein [Rhabdaerophilum sp.]|nr:HNH endonuclease signature motif containing protein [Rhabdaerophilum sp.]